MGIFTKKDSVSVRNRDEIARIHELAEQLGDLQHDFAILRKQHQRLSGHVYGEKGANRTTPTDPEDNLSHRDRLRAKAGLRGPLRKTTRED